MVDQLPNNLDEIIALRLELTQQERVIIKESIEVTDAKIKSVISHIGTRPKETDAELVTMMQKLEHTHTTTSQTNVQERTFMYDMKKLQEKKKYLVEYNSIQHTLDELKSKRTALQKEIREKDATLDELYLGSRKLKLADKIGCMASEIVETKFTVPTEKISLIIGKGGSTLLKIESDCMVSIDTKETKGGNIRITGTETSIALAITAVLTIVSTVNEEFSPSDEKIVCLILDKAALTHDIETRHNVRIDISRAKKVCKVIGQPDGVRSAIAEIKLIPALKVKIPIEVTILPFVVGKGGATIKLLGEGNRVQIDIDREEKHIVVLGYIEEVVTAVEALRDIISENTEVEEIIKIDKSTMIGCIIGTGGNTIRALQKEFNVQMKVDKVGDKVEKGELEVLTIRGVTSKVFPAKVKVLELLAEYLSNYEELIVPDDVIPMVVGKKGSKVTQLREKYPDAIIDIENTTVKIQSSNYETRQSIRDYINEIIKTNYTNSIPIISHIAIAMKGTRGNDIRSLFGILNLQFDITPELGTVKVRGVEENVVKAMRAIEAFSEGNQLIEITCHEDDFSSVLNMGNSTDSPLKEIELKYSVEIRPNRKDLTVRIRGEKNAIENAKKSLQAFLEGDSGTGSKVFSIDPQSFPAIIGKGGATLKKFELDNDVKIDLLKAKGCIRVRGSVDNMEKAIVEILKFIDEIKVNSTVAVSTLSKDEVTDTILQKSLESASSIFQIDISMEKSNITFRGNMHLVQEAKTFLKEDLSGFSNFILSVPYDSLPLIEKLSKEFDVIESKNIGAKVIIENTTINNDKKLNIIINGNSKAASSTKLSIIKLLKHHLSSLFVVFDLPPSCLKDMGAAFIYEISRNNQIVLTVDRPFKSLRVFGDEKSVSNVSEMIVLKFNEWKKHHRSVPVDDYMLPTIIGKNGAAIVALQKELNVKIHLNRSAMLLELESSSTSELTVLEDALAALEEKISGWKVHSWETVIDTGMIGLLVGKQGVRINKIRTDCGASVEINKATGAVEVRGTLENVTVGKELIMQIISEFPQTVTIQMYVPVRAIPTIIGSKGSKAKEITELSGARFDVDRVKETITLKGNQECCLKLKELIEEILEKEGFNYSEEVVVETVPTMKASSGTGVITLVGASSAENAQAQLQAQIRASELNMSKSAIRRKRRKEQDKIADTIGLKSAVEEREGEDEDEDEEERRNLSEKKETNRNGKDDEFLPEVIDNNLRVEVCWTPLVIATETPDLSLTTNCNSSDPSDLGSVSSYGAGKASAQLSGIPLGRDIVAHSPSKLGIIGRSSSSMSNSPTLKSNSPNFGLYHTQPVISPPNTISRQNSGEYNHFQGQNLDLIPQVNENNTTVVPKLDDVLPSTIQPLQSINQNKNQKQKQNHDKALQNLDTSNVLPHSSRLNSNDSILDPPTFSPVSIQIPLSTTRALPQSQNSSAGLLDLLLGTSGMSTVNHNNLNLKSMTMMTSSSSPSSISTAADETYSEQFQKKQNSQMRPQDLAQSYSKQSQTAGSGAGTGSGTGTFSENDTTNQKRGYYKSKSGFSVRL